MMCGIELLWGTAGLVRVQERVSGKLRDGRLCLLDGMECKQEGHVGTQHVCCSLRA
jgi:hypothetical protein